MSLVSNILIVLCAVPAAPGESPDSDPFSDRDIRRAVQRSLVFLEREGLAWMKERKCVSCHQIPAMIWSHYEARSGGVPVNEEKLQEWTDWSLGKLEKAREKNMDGINQIVLAIGPSPAHVERTKRLEALADVVLAGQQSDGTWKPGGQLPVQARPSDEIKQVSSTWAMLALSSMDRPGEAMDQGRRNLRAWLDNTEPPQSQESLVVRLLAERVFGQKARVQKRIEAILDRQNEDGGWSWSTDRASDALATGQTLYALSVVGMKPDHPSVQRALAFLLESQRDDGSWPVHGTRKKDTGETPTATYWGTGWAVVGLARSLPE